MCNNTTTKEQKVIALGLATPTILCNVLLLLAFKLKWRALTASKVYILALAFVCLLGGIVDFSIAVNGYKNQTSGNNTLFIGYNFHSCVSLLLVAMAISRWARTRELFLTSRGQSSERCSSPRQSRHRLRRLSTLLHQFLLGTNTVRGAKIVSGVVVVVGAGIALPLALIPCKFKDLTTRSLSDCTLCWSSWLALLALLSAVPLSLYALVLGRQCTDHFSQRRQHQAAARRRSSVFYTQQSCDSLGSLFDPYGFSEDALTRREGEACAAVRTKASSTLPRQVTSPFSSSPAGIHRCDTNPITRTELGWLRRKRKPAPRACAEDETGSDFLVLETAGLPPVAYSAQLCSLISLNIERSRSNSEGQAAGRRSVCSLPAPEVQSQGRQTTLIFLAMTLIHVFCYLTFFVGKLTNQVGFPVYLISTLCNPIVYCLGNRHFRAALFKLLLCRRDII